MLTEAGKKNMAEALQKQIDGTGKAPTSEEPKPCPECEGTGKLRGIDCWPCLGKGNIPDDRRKWLSTSTSSKGDFTTELRQEISSHWIKHDLNLGQYKSELWCDCGDKLMADGHAQDWHCSSTLVFNHHIAEKIAELVLGVIGEDEDAEIAAYRGYKEARGQRNELRSELRQKVRGE